MRVLTYNVHKCVGGRDRRLRIERVADVIRSVDADVVCLQEVTRGARRSKRQDQPKILAELLQLPHADFQLNVHYKEGGYGNLLLSRWPFPEKHHISLRRNSRKPRGAQLALIDSPDGAIWVVNFHLGLADSERLWQAHHLLQHRFMRACSDRPCIIAGDTNDWRGKLAPGPFAAHGFCEISRPASRFRTFPAWMPTGPLDKCFVRGEVAVRDVQRVRGKLARAASDHLPLWVELDLQSGS